MRAATADDLAGTPLFDPPDAEDRSAIAPWFELQAVSSGLNLTGEGGPGRVTRSASGSRYAPDVAVEILYCPV